MSRRDKKNLRSGFTTGAAAAAAVKGALQTLLTGSAPESVRIHFIGGGEIHIRIASCQVRENVATCTVIKDAGDDPDVTNKAVIGARVSIAEASRDRVVITGGEGVGTVTKPGLEIPPGEPAINPGPRAMIRNAVREVLDETGRSGFDVSAEIFVPAGERLAKNTLNFRLGIVGGISILGTTGIVRPMSHEAYIATIKSSLSVAKASGIKRVFFTTGRRSEKFAQKIWHKDREEAFIQIGDFFQMSLRAASGMDFDLITLTVFFGKAVKMAQGIPHTHAANSELCLQKLAGWVHEMTGDTGFAREIREANTARHAFALLGDDHPEVMARVGREIVRSAQAFMVEGTKTRVRAVIMDFEGRIVFDSLAFAEGDGGL